MPQLAASHRSAHTPTLSQRVPVDLVLVILVTLVTLLVTTSSGPAPISPIPMAALGFVFVLFVPGYALIAALFPAGSDSADTSVGLGERLVLSVGLSLFLTPMVSLPLSFSQPGISSATVIPAVSLVVLGLTLVAAYRRVNLPPHVRFGVPVGRGLRTVRTLLTPGEDSDGVDVALNALLVVGLVLAVTGLGIGLLSVENGERFTEFGVLAPDPTTGVPVADGYPETLVQGESTPLVLTVTNHEGRTVDYTVVVTLQRLDGDGRVVDSSVLDRMETTLGPGESRQLRHEVSPTMVGTDLRLTYFLYTDGAPATPTTENAYRTLHLWVDVTPT